jgi:hypothetical protein
VLARPIRTARSGASPKWISGLPRIELLIGLRKSGDVVGGVLEGDELATVGQGNGIHQKDASSLVSAHLDDEYLILLPRDRNDLRVLPKRTELVRHLTVATCGRTKPPRDAWTQRALPAQKGKKFSCCGKPTTAKPNHPLARVESV